MVLRIRPVGAMSVVSICAVVSLMAASSRADVLDIVGAMGDSLTDESWSVERNLPEQEPYVNWIEHLHESGRVSFGPRANYGSPRRDGYQHNYAYGGSTTATLLEKGQHTGLAGHNPTLAYLGIGGNDFAYHIIPHANKYLGDGEDPAVMLPQMTADFITAVETIAGTPEAPTGAGMILATVPDVGRAPFVLYADGLGHMFPGSLELYRNATAAFNDEIKVVGAERGFPVLDYFGLFDAIKGPLDDPRDSFEFGGVDIFMTLEALAEPSPTNAFLSDGFHPGTVVHGIMANMFIEALNMGYGLAIPLLSDQEILETAGIEPGTPPGVTTYLDVSPYVIVPEPGVAALMWIGAIVGLRRRRALS